MRRIRTAAAVAITGVVVTGCGSDAGGADPGSVASEPQPLATVSASPTPSPLASAAADPAAVKANELGQVPVMMYHQVKADPKGDYDQTPEQFRAELQRMYDARFRPITVRDLVAGKVDIPAGLHPVVLTFDDSTVSEAQIGADGNPTPDSALGIMEQFAKDHPDWKSTASFYVNADPFQDAKVLPWLVAHGYEVGVHTRDHTSLKSVDEAGVQAAIGGNVADIEAAAPGAEPSTISLPFGIAPANKALLRSGSFEGNSYNLTGALLVGANPSPSPFAAAFDPYAVPRIRSGLKVKDVAMDSRYWLDYFQKNPSSLYVSDGDPDKVSFPAAKADRLGDGWKDKANPYTESGSASIGSVVTTAAPTASPTSSSGS
jgi:hypothetical protein